MSDVIKTFVLAAGHVTSGETVKATITYKLDGDAAANGNGG
jgi:hypothetical protein